jgi:hypothetical protein
MQAEHFHKHNMQAEAETLDISRSAEPKMSSSPLQPHCECRRSLRARIRRRESPDRTVVYALDSPQNLCPPSEVLAVKDRVTWCVDAGRVCSPVLNPMPQPRHTKWAAAKYVRIFMTCRSVVPKARMYAFGIHTRQWTPWVYVSLGPKSTSYCIISGIAKTNFG